MGMIEILCITIQVETTDSRLVWIQEKFLNNGLILDFVHSRTRIHADRMDFHGSNTTITK